MGLAAARVCATVERWTIGLCQLANVRNNHRDVWPTDRHSRRRRGLVLWVEWWEQWAGAAKLGARRDDRYRHQQHTCRIFFQPARVRAANCAGGQVIPSSNGTATAGATGTDFGNVGRNVLRGPGQSNVDFSVIKRFPFRESKNIEFRAEFFNLFNHVNFANPISNLSAVASTSIDPNSGWIIGSPGDFGRIISTSNNPRMIQFAVKLNF